MLDLFIEIRYNDRKVGIACTTGKKGTYCRPMIVQFFKNNSYNIVKCLLNQIAITMFGLMIAFATAQSNTMVLIGSLFSVAFYLFLTYYMFWEIGGRDRIAEDSGRRTKTPLRGLLISGTATLPMLIGAIVLLIVYPYTGTYEQAGNLYVVVNTLTRVLHAMYLGLAQLYSPNNPIVWLLVCLPAPITAQIGYMLGNRNFRILGLIGIKPNLKEETR